MVFRPAPSSIITKLEASKTLAGSFKVLVLATSENSFADFFRVLQLKSFGDQVKLDPINCM